MDLIMEVTGEGDAPDVPILIEDDKEIKPTPRATKVTRVASVGKQGKSHQTEGRGKVEAEPCVLTFLQQNRSVYGRPSGFMVLNIDPEYDSDSEDRGSRPGTNRSQDLKRNAVPKAASRKRKTNSNQRAFETPTPGPSKKSFHPKQGMVGRTAPQTPHLSLYAQRSSESVSDELLNFKNACSKVPSNIGRSSSRKSVCLKNVVTALHEVPIGPLPKTCSIVLKPVNIEFPQLVDQSVEKIQNRREEQVDSKVRNNNKGARRDANKSGEEKQKSTRRNGGRCLPRARAVSNHVPDTGTTARVDCASPGQESPDSKGKKPLKPDGTIDSYFIVMDKKGQKLFDSRDHNKELFVKVFNDGIEQTMCVSSASTTAHNCHQENEKSPVISDTENVEPQDLTNGPGEDKELKLVLEDVLNNSALWLPSGSDSDLDDLQEEEGGDIFSNNEPLIPVETGTGHLDSVSSHSANSPTTHYRSKLTAGDSKPITKRKGKATKNNCTDSLAGAGKTLHRNNVQTNQSANLCKSETDYRLTANKLPENTTARQNKSKRVVNLRVLSDAQVETVRDVSSPQGDVIMTCEEIVSGEFVGDKRKLSECQLVSETETYAKRQRQKTNSKCGNDLACKDDSVTSGREQRSIVRARENITGRCDNRQLKPETQKCDANESSLSPQNCMEDDVDIKNKVTASAEKRGDNLDKFEISTADTNIKSNVSCSIVCKQSYVLLERLKIDAVNGIQMADLENESTSSKDNKDLDVVEGASNKIPPNEIPQNARKDVEIMSDEIFKPNISVGSSNDDNCQAYVNVQRLDTTGTAIDCEKHTNSLPSDESDKPVPQSVGDEGDCSFPDTDRGEDAVSTSAQEEVDNTNRPVGLMDLEGDRQTLSTSSSLIFDCPSSGESNSANVVSSAKHISFESISNSEVPEENPGTDTSNLDETLQTVVVSSGEDASESSDLELSAQEVSDETFLQNQSELSGLENESDKSQNEYKISVPENGDDTSHNEAERSVPENGDDTSQNEANGLVPQNGDDTSQNEAERSVPENGNDTSQNEAKGLVPEEMDDTSLDKQCELLASEDGNDTPLQNQNELLVSGNCNDQSPVDSPAPESGDGQNPMDSPVPESGDGQNPVDSPAPENGEGQNPVDSPAPESGDGQNPMDSPAPENGDGQNPVDSPAPESGDGQSPVGSPAPESGDGPIPVDSPAPESGDGQSPVDSPAPENRDGPTPVDSPALENGDGQSPMDSPASEKGDGQSPVDSQAPESGDDQSPVNSPAPESGVVQSPMDSPAPESGDDQSPVDSPAPESGDDTE